MKNYRSGKCILVTTGAGFADTGPKFRRHIEHGTVFTTTINSAALRFMIGRDRIISGLENAIAGMSRYERKTVNIRAAGEYGPHRQEMTHTIDRDQFPRHLKTVAGQKLQDSQTDGQIINVMVTDVSELTVTVDANYPLPEKT